MYNQKESKTLLATITRVTVKNNRVSIQTQDGEWLSFFQKDQRGQITSPQASFMTNNIQEGKTVLIHYVEKDSADGRVFKNVISFGDSSVNQSTGVNNNQRVATPQQSTAPTTEYYQQRQEDEVIGKTACQFLSAYIAGVAQAGGTLAQCQSQVDHAVMLAERLVAASKGPRRRAMSQKAAQPSPSDLAGPWDNDPQSGTYQGAQAPADTDGDEPPDWV